MGVLVPVLNVFRTQAIVIRKLETLKNISAKCCSTEKSEFSRSLW